MRQFEVLSWTADLIAAHDARINALIAQEAERKKYQAYINSGIGKVFFDERLDTYEASAKSAPVLDEVKAFLQAVRCGEFRTLVLCGRSGTGKTHLAAGLLYELGGAFRLSDVIREEYDAAKSFTAKYSQAGVITWYGSRDFLVIDEVGRTESATTASVEKHCLYRIINERYNNRLPTVFISNLTCEQFMAYIGSAAADRLTESAVFCSCDWDSYRAKKRGV